uniref:Uncharacterized protein n=1 Tax=Arundo donax TaxID=35708 RepID=A0A0A9H202_ARUDO
MNLCCTLILGSFLAFCIMSYIISVFPLIVL